MPSEQSWEWPERAPDAADIVTASFVQKAGDEMSGSLSGPDATLDRNYVNYKQLKLVDARSGQAIALAGQLSSDLGSKIPSALIGQPNGVAGLDSFGKVPGAQLPASVGGGGGSSLTLAPIATSDVTAEANKFYPLDTSGGSFDFILPDFSDGIYVTAKDHKNTWDLHPVTLKGYVEDSSDDFILDGGGLVELVRAGGTWKIINPTKAVEGSLSDINVTVTGLQTQITTVSGIAATAQTTADNATTPAEVQALIDASPGGSPDWNSIANRPSTFAPSGHAASHASGGTDPIAVAAAQVALSNGSSIQAAFDSGQLGGAGGATTTSGLTNNSPLPGTTLNDVLVGIDADKFDASGTLPQAQVSDLTVSLLAKQDATPTAPVNFNNQRGINLDTPINPNDVVNKAYADAVVQGFSIKQSCRLATTANITLSGVQTVDGSASATGDRIIVKNQTTPAQNGVYVANSAGVWTRAADMDTWTETQGAFALATAGATQANTGWVSQTVAGGVLGSTAITFAQFSAAGNYTFNGRAGPNFAPAAGDYTTAQITGISTFNQSLLAGVSAAAVRTSLALQGASLLNVGTTPGTVAAADDPRLVTTSSYLNAVTAGGAISVALAQTEVAIGNVVITPTSATSKIHVTASAEFTKDTGTTARTGVIRIRRGTVNTGPQVGQDGQGFSQAIASTKYIPRNIDSLDSPGVTTATTYTVFAVVLTAGASTAARYEITAVEERASGAAVLTPSVVYGTDLNFEDPTHAVNTGSALLGYDTTNEQLIGRETSASNSRWSGGKVRYSITPVHWFVDPSQGTNGSGTRGSPFNTIPAALGAASAGQNIGLLSGASLNQLSREYIYKDGLTFCTYGGSIRARITGGTWFRGSQITLQTGNVYKITRPTGFPQVLYGGDTLAWFLLVAGFWCNERVTSIAGVTGPTKFYDDPTGGFIYFWLPTGASKNVYVPNSGDCWEVDGQYTLGARFYDLDFWGIRGICLYIVQVPNSVVQGCRFTYTTLGVFMSALNVLNAGNMDNCRIEDNEFRYLMGQMIKFLGPNEVATSGTAHFTDLKIRRNFGRYILQDNYHFTTGQDAQQLFTTQGAIGALHGFSGGLSANPGAADGMEITDNDIEFVGSVTGDIAPVIWVDTCIGAFLVARNRCVNSSGEGIVVEMSYSTGRVKRVVNNFVWNFGWRLTPTRPLGGISAYRGTRSTVFEHNTVGGATTGAWCICIHGEAGIDNRSPNTQTVRSTTFQNNTLIPTTNGLCKGIRETPNFRVAAGETLALYDNIVRHNDFAVEYTAFSIYATADDNPYATTTISTIAALDTIFNSRVSNTVIGDPLLKSLPDDYRPLPNSPTMGAGFGNRDIGIIEDRIRARGPDAVTTSLSAL